MSPSSIGISVGFSAMINDAVVIEIKVWTLHPQFSHHGSNLGIFAFG
jgi:hypothetical protein